MTPSDADTPLTAAELAVLRGVVSKWMPRCAFTVLGDNKATSAVYECLIVRQQHDTGADGHAFVERPSGRLTIRRLLATLDATRAAAGIDAAWAEAEKAAAVHEDGSGWDFYIWRTMSGDVLGYGIEAHTDTEDGPRRTTFAHGVTFAAALHALAAEYATRSTPDAPRPETL